MMYHSKQEEEKNRRFNLVRSCLSESWKSTKVIAEQAGLSVPSVTGILTWYLNKGIVETTFSSVPYKKENSNSLQGRYKIFRLRRKNRQVG